MKTLFLVFALFSSLSSATMRTDFSEAGNQQLIHQFNDYKNAPSICAPANTKNRRVLLTGFGPFMSSGKNVSSESLYFWGQFHAPVAPQSVTGNTREFEINGEKVQICFLSVATTWDLAAAIIITEAEKFSPEFIFMTGVGGYSFVFERTSVNQVTGSPGYNSDGTVLDDNTPITDYILPPTDNDVLPEELMTWNAQDVWSSVAPMILGMGYNSNVEKPTTYPDDYICNNTRYVVARAARNSPVELAGGKIVLTPHFVNQPVVGFLHYSSTLSLDDSTLTTWSGVLAQIIATTL